MLSFILWYMVISLLGVISFPVVFLLFRALPDRGYTSSRVFGLLVWGYAFWFAGSLGVIRNNLGGAFFAFSILLILGVWSLNKIGLPNFRIWWNKNRSMVFVTEVLFFVMFAGWALVRAANPEITNTEKPMELAFINSILRSQTFPPHDPWLAGYGISYYYFGYVQIALLSLVTGVAPGIAFNLAVALIYGLSALGAFGVVYNLLAIRQDHQKMDGSSSESVGRSIFALLGPLYVLIVSNLEGFLEVLHARGIFWERGPQGNWSSEFWTWLDLRELSQPPSLPLDWIPSRFLWWWRASRVVQDYVYDGTWREVIDEFPFFSFLLADLHPHVFAIPFAFLAIILSLNLYLHGSKGSLRIFGRIIHIEPHSLVFAALILGSLAFLNTWDFPIYVALFCGTYTLLRVQEKGWGWNRLKDFLGLGFVLGIGGIFLYLPFYFGFSSQAGGILPNLVSPTRGTHLFIMFGSLLLPIGIFLVYYWRSRESANWKWGFGVAFGITGALWVISILLGWMITLIPIARSYFLNSLGASNWPSLLIEAIVRRFSTPSSWLILTLFIGFTLALLLPRSKTHSEGDSMEMNWSSPPVTFSLLIILLAALLVIIPEFIYLRDQFGTRMNTVFKFYYQAWLLWGVAAAFGTAILVQEVKGVWGVILNAGLVFLIGSSLIYPVLSLQTKTSNFNPTKGFRLDGTDHATYLTPDDAAAVDWLRNAPLGTLVEAVGGSYTGYGRISAHSGMPTLLGWPGHESQWRGGAEEMGSRQEDVERLYRTSNWQEAKEILEKYEVQYVYVGPLERSTYGVNENKFGRNLRTVFEQGQVVIYEVPKSPEL